MNFFRTVYGFEGRAEVQGSQDGFPATVPGRRTLPLHLTSRVFLILDDEFRRNLVAQGTQGAAALKARLKFS